jgi:hypothetical protein
LIQALFFVFFYPFFAPNLAESKPMTTTATRTPTFIRPFLIASSLGLAMFSAHATGLATCDSGPKAGWQPVEKLESQLKEKGYTVRRIKEDGGCYEVYALNEKGERGEFYFHPVTLEPVPIKAR